MVFIQSSSVNSMLDTGVVESKPPGNRDATANELFRLSPPKRGRAPSKVMTERLARFESLSSLVPVPRNSVHDACFSGKRSQSERKLCSRTSHTFHTHNLPSDSVHSLPNSPNPARPKRGIRDSLIDRVAIFENQQQHQQNIPTGFRDSVLSDSMGEPWHAPRTKEPRGTKPERRTLDCGSPVSAPGVVVPSDAVRAPEVPAIVIVPADEDPLAETEPTEESPPKDAARRKPKKTRRKSSKKVNKIKYVKGAPEKNSGEEDGTHHGGKSCGGGSTTTSSSRVARGGARKPRTSKQSHREEPTNDQIQASPRQRRPSRKIKYISGRASSPCSSS